MNDDKKVRETDDVRVEETKDGDNQTAVVTLTAGLTMSGVSLPPPNSKNTSPE